jgi:hypothetical protein
MSGFLSQIFEPDGSAILAEPSIDCIFAIRQLSSLFGKIELPCSNSRIVRTMEEYVRIEDELDQLEGTISTYDREAFVKMSNYLFADVFTRVDREIYDGSVQGRHGPGGTADGFHGNAKFEQLTWTERLEEIFPYGEYALPIWSFFELLADVEFLEPGQERPVKVIPVPKTLRGPRIIAMEPVCMQFMQQAVLRPLVRELEDPEEFVSSLLGFTDQIPNQEMAKEGSSSGLLATLDLKEASDRVPNWLVQSMLQHHPWLSAAVDATRSTRAEIPELGLSLPRLRKFASMGSALCFPFEAMVFLTCVSIGVMKSAGLTGWLYNYSSYKSAPAAPSSSLMKKLLGEVRVYGDDIIVPTHSVPHVIAELETFGFKVNRSKSFWKGKFRESCGGDFYDGQNVTPVRLRKEIPTSRADGSRVAAFVDFRNHLYQRGFYESAEWCDDILYPLLKGYFPIVKPTSPCLGRLSVEPVEVEGMDARTQTPIVKGWVLVPRIPANKAEGVWALVKCLSSPVVSEDPRHLERSGRPSAVGMKLRKVNPY